MKSKLEVFFRYLINLDFTDAIEQGVKRFAKTYQSNPIEKLSASQSGKTGKVTVSATTIEKIEKDPMFPHNSGSC